MPTLYIRSNLIPWTSININGQKSCVPACTMTMFTVMLCQELAVLQVLLAKSVKEKTSFIHAPTGCYDNELFTIIWGPTIAALSFVFDKSQDPSIVQKAISGFR